MNFKKRSSNRLLKKEHNTIYSNSFKRSLQKEKIIKSKILLYRMDFLFKKFDCKKLKESWWKLMVKDSSNIVSNRKAHMSWFKN